MPGARSQVLDPRSLVLEYSEPRFELWGQHPELLEPHFDLCGALWSDSGHLGVLWMSLGRSRKRTESSLGRVGGARENIVAAFSGLSIQPCPALN